MNALDNMLTRRSCRNFSSRMPSEEDIREIAEAGSFAPTGMNRQSPIIIAVTNKRTRDEISAMNAKIMGTDSNPYYGAPTIVLVFASHPEKWFTSVHDGTLVLGNMMNAAYAVGLGSCWIHREREMFDTPEGKAMMQEMGLPDGLMGVGALALGYPAKPLPPARPRKENYYRIVK